jgi:multicomponent Na+:H+ antiporter subunit B
VTDRGRVVVFLVAAAGLAGLFGWAFAGLPAFGHYRGPYGDIINAFAGPQRHATNAVTPVVFDYRGIDTLGEEFILFAAVMGVSVLLRRQRGEAEESPLDRARAHAESETGDAVRVAGMALVAPFVVLGLYIVTHGHLTPGGGFQGGVILAAAPVMVYLAGRYITFRQVGPEALLDAGEGMGAGGYAAVGFVGMLTGAAFLQNVLPLGQTGSIFSAGTIPVINLAVGLEVGAGLVLVVFEFLEQTLMVRSQA